MKPKNKFELESIMENQIYQYGLTCDLNHIDTSLITDMNHLFAHSKFNGDISKWDTSNVKLMNGLFYNSQFNGDISKWNTSRVTNMNTMFYQSKFDQDISNWDVTRVKNLSWAFYSSDFKQSIEQWTPLQLLHISDFFYQCSAPIPSWGIQDKEKRDEYLKLRMKAKKEEQLLNNVVKSKDQTKDSNFAIFKL